jgi:hypothetical protein
MKRRLHMVYEKKIYLFQSYIERVSFLSCHTRQRLLVFHLFSGGTRTDKDFSQSLFSTRGLRVLVSVCVSKVGAAFLYVRSANAGWCWYFGLLLGG